MTTRFTPFLAALALAAGPLAGAAAAATYTFGEGSEVGYLVVHPMHHVNGVSHGLAGKVTLENDKLVTPLTLDLALLSFRSGNANRDNNAAFTLDVTRYPKTLLEVRSFKETAHRRDAAGLHISGVASGRLTLHGMSHAVTVPLEGTVTGSKLTVDGTFTLDLTDYGITRPALLGVPVENAVKVTVHGVATGG